MIFDSTTDDARIVENGRKLRNFAGLALALLVAGCDSTQPPFMESRAMAEDASTPAGADAHDTVNLEKATFGSGCFWCTEAVFQQLRGVKSVVSGYSGGSVENPTYEEVCAGRTGHAEVIQVTYDPEQISYDDLLKVFWQTHDPTTLNRQGHDVGTQYRSAVFYHDDEQRRVAEQYKKQLAASNVFGKPIVTEIEPLRNFYSAENYHQNYYRSNPRQQYCEFVIRPKVEKFNKEFKDLIAPANGGQP
jgi:methionine-S-sulfoxide reductase